jgi:hypothetical protein
MAAKKQKPSIKPGEIDIPLHFNIPIEMPSVYATNMLVQSGEHEVIISFFEAQVPVFVEEDEDNIETLKKVGIRADCVAKVTIAKDRFEGFANAIKGFADRLKENK